MITPKRVASLMDHFKHLDNVVSNSVLIALEEDIGKGDLTALLIPETTKAKATIISRETAVICGIPWVNRCFRHLDDSVHIAWLVEEGETVKANQTLCTISGQARAMLTAERTALNFLQTLSGTASITRQYVDQVKDLPVKIMDTRKTLPGLRMPQKYAVTIGGGHNQRLALYDGILIKENHIALSGSIASALFAAQNLSSQVSIQIEVENLEQLDEALAAGASNILLDNFDLDKMRIAVDRNQKRAILEASGNVTLDTIRDIALTGVDRISIGALTKHIKAVDLSMRIKLHTR